jgi:hypothetical protein
VDSETRIDVYAKIQMDSGKASEVSLVTWNNDSPELIKLKKCD